MGYPQVDSYGRRMHLGLVDWNEVESMTSPVRCAHCGGVYDLGTVALTARFLDCSVWKAPCCKRTVDDRGPGWKTAADYERLSIRREPPVMAACDQVAGDVQR